MTFKPAIWYPIAVVVSIGNLIAVAFTEGPNQPAHATGHAALALVFGLWAYRLRQRTGGGSDLQARLEALEAEAGRVEALEGDVGRLRQEVSEAQERLDFAERVLAKGAEQRRADPPR